MDAEKAVDFIRNLNDFNSPDGEDFNWGKESEEWWENFKREKLDALEYDVNGKVLVVIEREHLGYAQMKWLRTLATIINDGMKRDLKEGSIDIEGFEKVDVDGIEYAEINQMTRMVLTTHAYAYLMEQYSA